MKEFENGVSFYGTYKAEIEISFPEDEICCRWCKYCFPEKELSRHRCRLTNEILYNPYVIGVVGDECPIKF